MKKWIKIPNEEELIAAGMVRKFTRHEVWSYPDQDGTWIPVECVGKWMRYLLECTYNYQIELDGNSYSIKKASFIREYKTRNDIQSGVHIWRTM
jgi:hypothetical protein